MPTLPAPIARRPRRLREGAARLRAAAARFRLAQGGIAAVEFALILPVMVTMYIGLTEITFGITTGRKLALLSRSLADLTGRATTMSASDISGIFAASTAVLQPYDASNASMVISSVLVTLGAGNTPIGTVDWSCAKLGTGAAIAKRAKGSFYKVPPGFEGGSSFILAEATYNYVPVFGGAFTTGGTIDLSEVTPWPVRSGTSVKWTGSGC